MDPGAFLIGLLGALATIGSVIALIIKSRGENKTSDTNAKTALDKRIDERVSAQLEEAWKRLDEQDTKIAALLTREARRTGAITRILRAIAKQWPGAEGPDLDPADIAEIEETIPAAWIRRKPSTKT